MNKTQRKQQLRFRFGLAVVVLSLVILWIVITRVIGGNDGPRSVSSEQKQKDLYIAEQPTLDVELLTVNKYSRPGRPLEKVNGIVVHWTANPGTSAIQNRNYFEGLKDGTGTYASSHFIIGLDGEIVQCIPCNEIAFASNTRNDDTIAIECCTEDDTGKFNGNTYESLLHLVTWLMGRYNLTTEDVIRHYDITGKDCPRYFVQNPDEWEKFKVDLQNYILLHGTDRNATETSETVSH